MFYTFGGAMISLFVSFTICEILGLNKNRPRYGFTKGDICILVATIFGGGIGFCYGSNLLVNGGYLGVFRSALKSIL